MHHSTPIILTIPLFSFSQLALACAPIAVDSDNNGHPDTYLKAEDGTIKYYQNTGSLDKPVFEECSTSVDKQPLEVIEVTETVFLAPEQTSANLSLIVNHPQRVKSVAATVRGPMSLKLDLPDEETETLVKMSPQIQTQVKFTGKTGDIFNTSGFYDIGYFVEADKSWFLSPPRSVVYKATTDNQAPTAFTLFSPPNGSKTKTSEFEFNWESSIDPEGDTVTYTVTIVEQATFKVVYRKEEVLHSKMIIDERAFMSKDSKDSKKFPDGTTFYWSVTAVDDYGNMTPSRHVFSFTTDDSSSCFNLKNDDGILGQPILPDNLTVNVLGGEQRYEVNLTPTDNQAFMLQQAIPTQQVHPHEAIYDPITGKLSIPSYGIMQVTQTPKQLHLNVIDD